MSLALTLAPYLFGDRDPVDRDGERERTRMARDSEIRSPVSASDVVERALVARLQAGDPSAMEAIVQRYADPLMRFAMTLTRSRDVAEELAYDALARVWERRGGLQPDRSLAPYLFTTVRNLAAHVAARARVRDRFATQALQAQSPEVAEHAATAPDDLLVAQETDAEYAARVAAVRSAVAALPERRREVLHLRFEQRMSYPEIGAIMGLSDKAAQQLVLRTLAALRRTLVQ